jgi:polyphenol oxidase
MRDEKAKMKDKNNMDNERSFIPHPSALIPASIFASLPWLVAGITPKDACAPAEPRPSFASRISALAGLPDFPFVHGCQPHGNAIAFVEKASLPEDCRVHAIDGVDALITPDAGVVLGSFTADCVPIALVDPVTRLLAVVHAGRVGTRLEITRLVVEAMQAHGATPQNLLAWIAPSVCADCYQVSAEIAEDFRAHFEAHTHAIGGSGGRHLDLSEINRCELVKCGLLPQNIEVDTRCTVEHPDLFHSYRRNGEHAGRMATVLARIA